MFPLMLVRFGSFELDVERFELRRRGELVSVQPRVLDIIVFLVKNNGRLLTKRDFEAGPWRGTPVTDAAIMQAIRQARTALREDGDTRGFIHTVRGKGYRFEAELSALDAARASSPTALASSTPDAAGAPSSSPAPDSHSSPTGPSTTPGRAFYGRQRELEWLSKAAAEARAGCGNLVLVHGPAGVGKTRLSEWFASSQRAMGTEVCWGGCREGQTAPPFWPWPEVLGRYADARDEQTLSELARGYTDELVTLAPNLAAAFGVTATPAEESAHRARSLLDSVAAMLRRAAQLGPLLVVLEDMHLADDPALELFQVVARSIGDTELFILATCRTEEAAARPRLAQALAGELPHVHACELGGLSLHDVRQWLGAAAPAPVPEPVVEALHFATGGHPLLLTSLMDTLPSHWDTNASDELSAGRLLPERLQQALRHHFSELDPEALALLKTACVFGEEFPLGVLASVQGVSVQALLPALERAQTLGLLKPAYHGRQRFAHALQRDLLYGDLDAAERVARHLATAQAFAEQLGHQPDLIVDAAHHFVLGAAAGQPELVVSHAQRAAEWSRQRHAYAVAERYYQKALDVLDLGTPNPQLRAELLLELGHTQFLAGNVPGAQQTFHQTFEVCRSQQFHDLFCQALVVIFHSQQEAVALDATFHERLHEALNQPRPKDLIFAQLQTVRAMIGALTVPAQERAGWVEEALAIVRSQGDARALMDVARGAFRSYTRFDDGTTLLSLADEILQAARRLHSAEGELQAGLYRLHALLEAGRGDEFEKQLGVSLQQAAMVKSPPLSYWMQMLQSAHAFLRGALAETEELARQSGLIGSQFTGIAAMGHLFAQLSEVGLQLGHCQSSNALTDAITHGETLLQLAPNYTVGEAALARVRLRLGEAHAARQLLKRVQTSKDIVGDPYDRNHITSCAMLADMACELRDQEACHAISEECARHVRLHATGASGSAYFGPMSYWLGRLSLVSGDNAEAQRWLELAVQESEQVRSVIYRAWAEFYLAQALDIGEQPRRAKLIDSARQAAERYELGHLTEQLETNAP